MMDDFTEKKPFWDWRRDGVSRIAIKDSILRLCMGPTEALYYSNAEISDGGFTDLKWSSGKLIVKARLSGEGFPHYGSAGFGFWNYSMRIDLSYPIWYIYLRSVRKNYPLQGFFIQVGNKFLPVKLTRPIGLYKVLFDVFSFAAPIKILSSKPVMQEIDLSKWHTYSIDWRNDKAVFAIDDHRVAEIPVNYTGKARIDAWIDNAVFQPQRGDPAYVFRHITHENRRETCLEIDWVRMESHSVPGRDYKYEK